MQQKIDNIKSSRRNQKKTLFYLFFTVLFISILVLWVIYHRGDNYTIQNVIQRPSIQKCGKDFGKEIQTTRVFVENFINSYQYVIEKEINPEFKDSFSLSKGRRISTIAIFSTVSEAFLGIYPSNQNDLIIECSKYPVQMSLFSGIEEKDSGIHLTMSYEEALKDYNDNKAMFRRLGFGSSFSNLTLSCPYPKVLSFSKNTIITFNNVSIEIKGSDEKVVRKTDIEHVGIITGEKDFSFAIEKAEELGKHLAEIQIFILFTKSPLFKTALLDEHLSSIAKEINQNYSKAEKDPEYKYPLWKLKEDMAKLKEEAKKYEIDASYIDDLLKYPSNQPKDGHLLWYYSNHFWFSVQWTIINTCLLLVFITLIILKNRNNKIAVLINRLWPKLAVLLGINFWVFAEKPKYMNIKYWIIPGLIFVLCFLLTVLKSKDKKQKSIKIT